MADSKLSSTVERVSEEELMNRLGGPLRLRVINPLTGEVIPNQMLRIPNDDISPTVDMVCVGIRDYGFTPYDRIPTWNTFRHHTENGIPMASWDTLFHEATGIRGYGFMPYDTIPTWNTFQLRTENGILITSWDALFHEWGRDPILTISLVWMSEPAPENRVRWEDLSVDDYPIHAQSFRINPAAFFAAHGYTLCEQDGSKMTLYAKSS